MKTDDLILAMSADALPRKTVMQHLLRAFPMGLGATLLAFMLFWGARPDIWQALGSAAALKTVVPLGAALSSGALALALAHPGARVGARGPLLGLLVAAVLGLFLFAFAGAGVAGVRAALSTPQFAVCLMSIPVLGVPLLATLFWAFSEGAALRPRITGALAGLAAGGASASVYSLYCDKDMVLFVVPSYSTAIAGLVVLGAVLGPRLLKW